MASPRPTSYAPRSQAMSPWRGSDPDSPGRRCRRRGPALAEPAAAAARCRAKPNLVGWRGGQPSIAASASVTSLRPRDPAVSPPEHPSQAMPHDSSCPSRNSWSAAASIAVWPHRDRRAEPSPAPRTRHRSVDLRLALRAQEYVADLGQQLLSAVDAPRSVAVHQRHAQRRAGRRPTRYHHWIVRQPASASSISPTAAIIGPAARRPATPVVTSDDSLA